MFSMHPTGYKLAKYDRGPDPDVDDRGVKITAKGKIKWSQTMLGNLQLSRQRALKKVAGKKDALGPMWKEEWTKMYPDLKVTTVNAVIEQTTTYSREVIYWITIFYHPFLVQVDWRSVIGRYNYHFGAIDEANSSLNVSSKTTPGGDDKDKIVKNEESRPTPNSATSTASDTADRLEDDGGGGHNPKVKGFRGSWSPQAKQDLLRTRDQLVSSDPTLEPGSSEFNRRLLKDFTVLHPKVRP